tara:strand:- start:8309 stop:9067 length:759 start_codon:yes stop_codon:yes gene_type:complete
MSRSCGVTHPGMKRSNNQDTFFSSDENGFWVLADGMGGNKGGEIASRIAQESIVEGLKNSVELKTAILTAHRSILDYGTKHQELVGLATTIVLLKESFTNAEASLAWVGDSRAYLWRNQTLSQLSKDHSVVQRLLDSGMITPEEAIDHPKRNLVTSILGLSLSNESDLEIGMVDFKWRKGDKILLCSDGLTDELSDSDIVEIMSAHSSSEKQMEALLQAALSAGGRDNTTVVLIEAPPIKSLVQRILNWFKT